MDKQEILYQDHALMITYLELPDEKGFAVEDHELWVLPNSRYAIPRGVLKDLAHTSRTNLPSVLDRLDPALPEDLKQHNLTPDSVGVACCQAYMKEQKRVEEWKEQQPTSSSTR